MRRVLTVFALTALSTAAQQGSVSLRELSGSLERLSDSVHRAVVQIYATGYATAEDSGESGAAALLSKQRSTGSGVILSPDGYIVTNNHVVRLARRIQVRLPAAHETLPDHHTILRAVGPLFDAKLVGFDRQTDLAVIKIDAKDLAHLPLGDSNDLRQGQLVMAFGNPRGLEGSVSMGVISSVARQIKPEEPMVYIQTDAPINPGNSGGPLIDTEGRVVGINTFILSESGGSEGLGFAIPSNIVKNVYNQIRTEGHVHRGQIGIFAQTITPPLAKGLGLPREWGVLVTDVDPDGPAEDAGVKIGDVILTLDGKPMDDARQLHADIYEHRRGDKLKLELQRGDQLVKAQVEVMEVASDPMRFADLVNPEHNLVPRLGILCIAIDKRLADMLSDELRLPFGVVIAGGSATDLGSGTGLQPGDVIYSVNGEAMKSVDALNKKLAGFEAGQSPVLQIQREGRLMFVVIELE
jgi:serine protease Do